MTRSGLRRVRALSAPEVVFVVALVVAIPVLRWTNRDQWFFLDEWDFLSDRSIGDLGGLFRPHNGHWALLPILVYRGLFAVFGLHHYWPYQAVTIALHLTLAVCMRALIRRAGADPWLATAGAMLFIGRGSGRANIGWAFQMGFRTVFFGSMVWDSRLRRRHPMFHRSPFSWVRPNRSRTKRMPPMLRFCVT